MPSARVPHADTVMKAGDIVQVLVQPDEPDAEAVLQYAIVNEVKPDGVLWVNYIEPAPYVDESTFELDDDAYVVTRESVNAHYAVDDSTAEALQESFAQIELAVVRNDEGMSMQLQSTRAAMAACDGDDDDSGDESSCSDDDFVDVTSEGYEKDGFVVSDCDDEAFTKAPETSAFVKDTHQAVRDFERWEPATDGDKRVKEWVSALAGRAAHENEDALMAAGKPSIMDYNCR